MVGGEFCGRLQTCPIFFGKSAYMYIFICLISVASPHYLQHDCSTRGMVRVILILRLRS